ncbi:MAG TPA: hypothetical protein V6C72_17520 [Chroococcales cyanobacterium]
MPRRKDDVSKLLVKLQNHAGNGPATETENSDRTRQMNANLPVVNINPYREADAWPGANYALVGNSMDYETRNTYSIDQNLRTTNVANALAQGGKRRMIPVTEAIQNHGFNQVLSCFERNWLNRISRDMPETMIGPAYDHSGNLVGNSFAVWRYLGTQTGKQTTTRKQKSVSLAGVS